MHMSKKVEKPQNLLAYIEYLQSRGHLTFTGIEAIAALKISRIALSRAAERLIQKKRIIHPVRGFYVIVPIEKRHSGAPDPLWFIDALMKYHGLPYYVGVLSAAALHGAAHQAPQEIQIVTNSQLRPLEAGTFRIRFLKKKSANVTATQLFKTPTGQIPVSTPEATALDLVKYLRWAGQLNNTTTVLSELAEKIDATRLVTAAKSCGELAVVQRLGYLLDQVAATKLTKKLHEWLSKQKPGFAVLHPGMESSKKQSNKKWTLIINDKLEIDQ
jgi:predicted transcriptional regulator of viral defense system